MSWGINNNASREAELTRSSTFDDVGRVQVLQLLCREGERVSLVVGSMFLVDNSLPTSSPSSSSSPATGARAAAASGFDLRRTGPV